jgi:hypothetical protein
MIEAKAMPHLVRGDTPPVELIRRWRVCPSIPMYRAVEAQVTLQRLVWGIGEEKKDCLSQDLL